MNTTVRMRVLILVAALLNACGMEGEIATAETTMGVGLPERVRPEVAPRRGEGPRVVGDRSVGCGTAPPAAGETRTIEVGGIERSYQIRVPANYAPMRAVSVVIAFHAGGDSANSVAPGYYGLAARSPSWILVAPHALADDAGQYLWRNDNGLDLAFWQALLDEIEASYCVDRTRVFAMGYSFGGHAAQNFALASGRLRAIATVNSALLSKSGLGGAVPAWTPTNILAWNSEADETCLPMRWQPAWRVWRAVNDCDGTPRDYVPGGCSELECENARTVLCEHDRGHGSPPGVEAAAADFLREF